MAKKKKHVPGEEVFTDAPVVEEEPEPEPEPETEPMVDEAEAVAPEPEIPSPAPAKTTEAKVDACENCGLPTKDFYLAFTMLRGDLQGQNGRNKCPRCFKPVKPY